MALYPSSRRVRHVVALSVAALAVSACSGTSSTTGTRSPGAQTPTSPTPTSSASLSSSAPPATGTASRPAGTPLPASTPLPAQPPVAVAAELLAGTNTGLLLDEAKRVFATWPVVVGAPELNASFVEQTRAEVAEATKANHAVNQQWHFVGVSPDMVGIRTVTVLNGAGSTRNSYKVTWYNLNRKETISPAQLFSAGQIENVREEVVRQLTARTGLTAAVVDEKVTTFALDALSFDGQTGDLIVEMDDGVVGTGRQAVRVPAGQVSDRLSDEGKAALASARRPRSVRAGQEASSPAATPVPASRAECNKVKCVALVFAAGPTAATADTLDALSKAKAPATFFPVGTLADVRSDLVERAKSEGHQVGNGTRDHLLLTGMDTEAQLTQLGEGATSAGIAPSSRVLLPYGRADVSTAAAMRQLTGGAPVVVQPTLDSEDWMRHNAAATVARVKANVAPGTMVLLRDSEPTTAQAIGPLVSTLRAQGYTLVTVDRLLGPRRPIPGRTYDRGAMPPAQPPKK